MRIVAIQGGPCGEDIEANLSQALKLIDQVAVKKPNFIIFNELFNLPTFCFSQDLKYFEWSEPLRGRTLQSISERSKQYQCYILVPFFEKGEVEGEYYNSVAVIGPNGNIIPGKLPNGKIAHTYRKTHIPSVIYKVSDTISYQYNEKFYFKPGPGLPIFHTELAKIGILICSDRCFPEAWRVLALQGAEIIFMPAAIPSWEIGSGNKREDLFLAELRVRAMENQLFVVGCNKFGREVFLNTDKTFFGNSCIIGPTGNILAQAASGVAPVIVETNISLQEIPLTRRILPFYMMRRPEIYGPFEE